MSESAENTPQTASLQSLLKERILILDGAYGTALQGYDLTEEDYRGSELSDHAVPVKGNHDLLCLTRPELITDGCVFAVQG